MNVKQWLTEEEYALYGIHSKSDHSKSDPGMNDILESLAAERELSETRRALLEKHQWRGIIHKGGMILYDHCLECKCRKQFGDAPDCAIATVLKGVGGGKV